ncbi:MAG: hypothetical protein ACRD96_08930, partial [Bryobacteraceae bacterium]
MLADGGDLIASLPRLYSDDVVQVRGLVCFRLLLAAATACMPARAATGSAACAACHSEIYRNYMRTPMAMSSGRVGMGGFQEKFDQSEFSHARSGVGY